MKLKQKLFLTVSAVALAFVPALSLAQESAGDSANINIGLAVVGGGLAALGAAVGIGLLSGRLLEAIARQPELEAKLKPNYFIGVGLTDAVPIIVIALSMMVLFGVVG